MKFKSIGKNVVKKGVPSAAGGALAVVADKVIDKYAVKDDGTSILPDWLSAIAPGLIGVALQGKEGAASYVGAGMIGYATGKAIEPKVTEMLGDDILADELDEYFGDDSDDDDDDDN